MVRVTTNNIPRDVLYGFELTARERAEFDYYSTEEELSGAQFFRYKGEVYDLGEFTVTHEITELREWGGYQPDSFFSGLVVRYVPDTDYEQVIVGRYMT